MQLSDEEMHVYCYSLHFRKKKKAEEDSRRLKTCHVECNVAFAVWQWQGNCEFVEFLLVE